MVCKGIRNKKKRKKERKKEKSWKYMRSGGIFFSIKG
jgi:hypothetical protein